MSILARVLLACGLRRKSPKPFIEWIGYEAVSLTAEEAAEIRASIKRYKESLK